MAHAKSITSGIAVLLIAGAAFLLSGCGEKKPIVKKKAESLVVEVALPPPPPPPLPPPPPEQEEPEPEPEKQEMIEQEPVAQAEPEEAGPEEPPADLGTGLTGDGPNGFGLSNRGDGNGGGGKGKGGRSGGRFDRYAVLLQNTLAAELRRNPKTRVSAFNVKVELRIDANGRISSLKPKASTGDPELDQALRNDFVGVQFSEAPPADMPMPIHTRVSGRKR